MSIDHLPWSEMSVKERAEALLEIGVSAELDIDREHIDLAFVAHVEGVGHLMCGYFKTEREAIDAGTTWLREKAQAA